MAEEQASFAIQQLLLFQNSSLWYLNVTLFT